MSMIKQYIEDRNHLAERAAGVAWIADDTKRWTALDKLFAGCGELASEYAEPERVTAAFVDLVVKAFQAARAIARRPLPELAA